jgi:hypothetical protein
MNKTLFVIFLLFLPASLYAQQVGSAAPFDRSAAAPSPQSSDKLSTSPEAEPALPVRTIDLSKGKALIGLLDSPIAGYPWRCTSDGASFVEIYDYSPKTLDDAMAELFSISASGEVKKIQRNFPKQNRDVTVRSFYPGESLIATLFNAQPEKKPASSQADDTPQYFLSLSKRDGTFSKQIQLDLKFEPLKIAVLDSGRFLALGVGSINQEPLLALLDTDGTFVRRIDLDPNPLNSSPSLQAIYKKALDASNASSGAAISAGSSDFVPYGSKVLYFQPGSDLPVHILGERGEENAVRMSLPKGYLPISILASAKGDTWVVRTQRLATFANLQNKGIVENPEQQLFEVDPVTGETLRELHVQGVHPGEITCATDKKLTALGYTSAKDKTATSSSSAGWKLKIQDR